MKMKSMVVDYYGCVLAIKNAKLCGDIHAV